MQIIKTIEELRSVIGEARLEKKQIGFVPTMGGLHPGHLSLVKASVEECDLTVVSIYINPIQFDSNEDMASYPRDSEADTQILKGAGVDLLFLPDDKHIYSEGFSTYVEVSGDKTNTLCGISRPGHFRGVATIVCKLFNIVQPDKAYFGLKDGQQAVVISQMVSDLNLPIDVRLLPTVREKDGLAYSSRNKNLSKKERKDALILNKILCHAQKRIMEDQESETMKVTAEMYEMVSKVSGAKVDYISIVNMPKLEEIEQIKDSIMVAAAVYIGETRLIDNLILNVEDKSK